MQKSNYKTVDEYIALFPPDIRKLLEKVRETIRKAVPKAEEVISYQMPTFKLNGKALVYFAGYEKHIGFYPVPSGIAAFKKELSVYKQGKGSVQFPLDKPLPLELIKEIVEFRAKENLENKKNTD